MGRREGLGKPRSFGTSFAARAVFLPPVVEKFGASGVTPHCITEVLHHRIPCPLGISNAIASVIVRGVVAGVMEKC